jgi:hypothetical protein
MHAAICGAHMLDAHVEQADIDVSHVGPHGVMHLSVQMHVLSASNTGCDCGQTLFSLPMPARIWPHLKQEPPVPALVLAVAPPVPLELLLLLVE